MCFLCGHSIDEESLWNDHVVFETLVWMTNGRAVWKKKLKFIFLQNKIDFLRVLSPFVLVVDSDDVICVSWCPDIWFQSIQRRLLILLNNRLYLGCVLQALYYISVGFGVFLGLHFAVCPLYLCHIQSSRGFNHVLHPDEERTLPGRHLVGQELLWFHFSFPDSAE